MNGYFQLIGKEDGTYIRLIPFEKCDEININEINEYLTDKRIYDFDIKKLNAMVTKAEEKVELKLNNDRLLPTNEHLRIRLSADKMMAIGRFYPPSNGGKKMSVSEIKSSLSMEKIEYGILEDKIELYVKKGGMYCKDIILAKGTPITRGHDAKIEYFFPTDLNSKPRMNPDGTVDFHHLDNIAKVEKGALLARLIPEDLGKAGMNVLGEVIRQPSYQKQKLKYGKNITISEDKTELYSDFAGHVSLVEGKVFVANQYEVEDVDNSTGNIEYDGNVIVKGNVRSGFEIKAEGEIRVQGVVEGAVLIAGGDIILERGIQGMNKGVLQAGGNVITKFIESASVKAGGYVHTEAILHSRVIGKNEVIVQGKKGFITGGEVMSMNKVTAKTIGSPMGTDTVIEVGIDPETKSRSEELSKRIKELRIEVNKISPIITDVAKKKAMGVKFNAEQTLYIKTLSENYRAYSEEMNEANEEMEELKKSILECANARVKVTDKIYSDVKLVISDGIMFVRKEYQRCQFVCEAEEIKILQL